MGHAGHVARLGGVGGFGQVLGGLQRGVGAAVGVDLLREQLVLAVRLLLGQAAALAAQHHHQAPMAATRESSAKACQKALRSAPGPPTAMQRLLLVVDHARITASSAIKDTATTR